jgi:hypothetical protein
MRNEVFVCDLEIYSVYLEIYEYGELSSLLRGSLSQVSRNRMCEQIFVRKDDTRANLNC